MIVDFEDFGKKYYPNASQQQIKDINRFLARAAEVIEKSQPDELIGKDELCRLFYSRKDFSGMSRANYYKLKGYLLNLFDYCKIKGDIPSHEEVLTAQPVASLFKDFDTIISFIDAVGYSQLPRYDKWVDLIIIKVLVTLGWIGLSLEEIAALPRRCTKKLGEDSYVVISGERTIEIDSFKHRLITALASIDSYRGIPSGKIQTFRGNQEMLFRCVTPLGKAPEKNDTQNLRSAILRFNEAIPKNYGYTISFRSLHKNALFVKIHQDQTDEDLLKKIIKHAQCSLAVGYGYKKEYLHWVSLFYNEKIE